MCHQLRRFIHQGSQWHWYWRYPEFTKQCTPISSQASRHGSPTRTLYQGLGPQGGVDYSILYLTSTDTWDDCVTKPLPQLARRTNPYHHRSRRHEFAECVAYHVDLSDLHFNPPIWKPSITHNQRRITSTRCTIFWLLAPSKFSWRHNPQ